MSSTCIGNRNLCKITQLIQTTVCQEEYLNHPYAIDVLVSSVSFLIIFRANYGYQRYWEACTMVHKLMSKWMDAAIFASVFHLQSDHYKDMRPPSFFDHDELNQMDLTRSGSTSQRHTVTTVRLLQPRIWGAV